MKYLKSMKLWNGETICGIESDCNDNDERELWRIETQYYTNLIHEGELIENWWHIILKNNK